MGDSKKKELIQGVAAVGAAAVALASGPIGVLAAALPTIASMGFDAIKSSDRRRAMRLLEHMIEADECPADFAAQLHEKLGTDEDVIAAFRMLVASSIESVSPAAVEPIALIGRRFLRGTCPAWIARGWLRVLSERTSDEIGQLRALIQGAQALRLRSIAEYYKVIGTTDVAPWTPRVRLRAEVALGVQLAPDTMPPHVLSVTDLTRPAPPNPGHDQPAPRYAVDYAERLLAELERHHLGSLDNSYAVRDQRRRQEERERKRDEALTRGESPKLRTEPAPQYPTIFVFDDMCFEVILEAFPHS